MKVLIDTNIIVDVALERQPFYPESIQVISLAYQKHIEGYISASTWSDIYYIIRKQKGREYGTSIANQLNAIVTRNPQYFPVVSPRIITPSQLIEELGNLP